MIASKELYSRVENLRKQRGMTINELSAKAGISHSTLNAWKVRGTMPKLEVLEGLSDALNVPLASLLFDVYTDQLTGEEIALLSKWKKIDEKQKKVVFDMLDAFQNTPGGT